MRVMVFSIFDVKADTYNTVFVQPTIGMAVRAFADLANDKSSTVNKHPEDYKLVKLGEFDDSTGKLISEEVPVSLGFATEHVIKEESAGIRRIS